MMFIEHTQAKPAAIVIFGASGDLTQRKLAPALHSLSCAGLLSPRTRIIGVARSPLSDEQWRQYIYEGVVEYARLKPGSVLSPEGAAPAARLCELWPSFAGRFSYLVGDYDNLDTYRRLTQQLNGFASETLHNCLLYLATPPFLYPLVIEQLGQSGLNRNPGGWTRIIIEKPFGHDLASAVELDRQVHTVFDESQVYRIDHYLGKETVQNLLTFRFANAIFEPLWNRNYVDHVQIAVAESVGVEHRARYYDRAGVVRDMVQNHLLQLLALMAMEPPVVADAKALRDEKVKVLHAVRPITATDVVLGQYVGYREEPNVAPDSRTPTYVALRLWVNNWRWRGVPFYLRTGKRLAQKVTEITLQFKQVPHLLFPESEEMAMNRLTFAIQPDEGIYLRFGVKIPGAGMRVAPVDMEFHYSDRFGQQVLPEAYERLLLDAIQGDASLFARSDEIERAWALVDPILDDSSRPLFFYEPGTWGPKEADTFLAQEDRAWCLGCSRM